MQITASALMAEVPDLMGHETQRLLLAAVGEGPSWIVGDPPVSDGAVETFRAFVERRRRGEPLQYIEGSVAFGPLELAIDRRALIPRPETERLWELAVGLVDQLAKPTIVDLCTGSGNIALALKHSLPGAVVVGTDLSAEALDLATENATALGLEVDFHCGDLFEALPDEWQGNIDLIVSNPPYVADGELGDLPAEVRDHEPHGALFAETDGLAILRRIASAASTWLKPGGAIICEIGETQGDACRQLFISLEPEIELDLAGRDRFVVGWSPMRPDLH